MIDATTEEAVQEDTANDIEEAQEAETVSEETPVEKGNNTIVVIIVIAVVAVIAGVVIVINKKKGSN